MRPTIRPPSVLWIPFPRDHTTRPPPLNGDFQRTTDLTDAANASCCATRTMLAALRVARASPQTSQWHSYLQDARRFMRLTPNRRDCRAVGLMQWIRRGQRRKGSGANCWRLTHTWDTTDDVSMICCSARHKVADAPLPTIGGTRSAANAERFPKESWRKRCTRDRA